jgi:hypothetical protein
MSEKDINTTHTTHNTRNNNNNQQDVVTLQNELEDRTKDHQRELAELTLVCHLMSYFVFIFPLPNHHFLSQIIIFSPKSSFSLPNHHFLSQITIFSQFIIFPPLPFFPLSLINITNSTILISLSSFISKFFISKFFISKFFISKFFISKFSFSQ